MHMVIDLPSIKVSKRYLKRMYELISRINERAKIGHFEIATNNLVVSYRHGLLLPGTRTISDTLIEDLTAQAVEICDKFYPAFQFVSFGDKTPEEAAEISFIETMGEA